MKNLKHYRWHDYIQNGEILPNTILVTLTNYGYTELTSNIIKSIEASTNNLHNKRILIHIGCIDIRSCIFWNQFNMPNRRKPLRFNINSLSEYKTLVH